ncbi:hypothetical protein ACQP2U_43225 (plasmid) [Nocardia sp. CA-084685]|uniref:hypothetical protein n=1 Tax=Nocardia sp. CA-084685 TaxID=3239970 RepID=UPI003D9954C7
MSRALLIMIAVAAVLAGAAAAIIVAHDDDTTAVAPSPNAGSTTPSPPTGSGFADPTSDRLGRKVAIPNNPAGQVLVQREPAARTEYVAGQAVPSPESVMIQRSYTMPILMSTSDGPTRLDGTTLVGYRRSPQGAALAAWNFIARAYASDPAVTVEALNKLAILKPDDHAALTNPTIHQPPDGDRYRRLFTAPDGFRILSYDDTFAAVELALQIPGEPGSKTVRQWAGVRMNLLWRNNDWKVQTPEDPRSLGSGQTYPTLTGWTTWAF